MKTNCENVGGIIFNKREIVCVSTLLGGCGKGCVFLDTHSMKYSFLKRWFCVFRYT